MKEFMRTATVAVIAAMLACSNRPAQAQQPAVQVLLEKARVQEGRGRMDLAVQTWRHVLLSDRNNTEALAGLARAAKQAGKPEEARQYLDRLRAINPKHEAIAQVESLRAGKAAPDRLAQAGTLAKQQRYAEAVAVYREVLGDEPPPGALAIAYYETLAATSTGWEAATAGLSRLAARYPQSLEYQLSLARLYTYRPKSRAEGIRMLQGLASNPGWASRADDALRQALLWDGPAPSNAPVIRAYLTRHKDNEVEALLTKMPKAETTVRSAAPQSHQEHAGYESLKLGRLAQAALQFQEAIEAAPNSSGALAGLGYVRMQEKRFGDAEDLFRKARAAAPDKKEYTAAYNDARFWGLLANATAALQKRQMADARKQFEEALSLRPDSTDAQRGLAGVLMAEGKGDEAAALLTKLAEADPDNADAWRDLVRAQLDGKGAEAALAVLERVPAKAALRLADDPLHQALLAAVYQAAGRTAEAAKAVERSLQTSARLKRPMPSTTALQFAGIWLGQGQAAKAADLYQQVVDREPSNLIAWEGLLAALVNLKKEERAAALLQRMTPENYDAALQRPGFVRLAAIVETQAGRLEQAEKLLSRVIADAGEKAERGTQLQLADIWIKQNRTDKAEAFLRGLAKQHPDEPEVWRSLVMLLEKSQRQSEAMLVVQRIPAETRLRLWNDPDFVALLASVYSGQGDDEEALRLVRTAEKRLAQQQRQPSPDLLLQHGWLALKASGDDREIYAALTTLQQDTERLDDAQRKNLNDLWSVWTRKRAENARQMKDLPRAIALLEAGHRMFPEDAALRSSLAGALLESGNHKRSLELYKTWGLKDASPADYIAAIGAAMAEDRALGDKWMREALNKWGDHPDVLDLAGKFASQRGNYEQARTYWAAALTHMKSPRRPAADTHTVPFLFEGGDPGRPNVSSLGGAPASSAKLGVAFAFGALDPAREALLSGNGAALPETGVTEGPRAEYAALRPDLERQIAAVEARNASFAGMDTRIDSRSGRDGFERRTIQEAEIEASHTLANAMRVALVARPTNIDGGTMDGSSALRFGTLPRGASLGKQTASGLGAEVQLSSNSFGLMAGVSPQGFAVQNWIGGLRFRPGNGPLQIKLVRENVRDTMLSFAGGRDTVTGQTWGGVVSTGGNLQVNLGDDRSGWYAGAGFYNITGQNVLKNRRMDGTVGAYWKVYGNSESSVTVGLNAFTMRYDKNLRYFTLGHGGYFSPQSYYLVNVPITWSGRYQQRFLYNVTAAFGAQRFREDASPFFPTLPSLQGRNGPSYEALSNTGPNYSVQGSLLYQVASHWYAGGFFSTNNTRNFNSQSAGFSVKYLFQERPLINEQNLSSIPNWVGQQPFQPR